MTKKEGFADPGRRRVPRPQLEREVDEHGRLLAGGHRHGPEIQWGKRENFRDGFSSDDFRIQFSAKYNFSLSLGGK
jgi:hypothetical protein